MTQYEKYTEELTKLSKKYGIILTAIGGVQITNPNDMENFKGYTTDLESGDLEPIWTEK